MTRTRTIVLAAAGALAVGAGAFFISTQRADTSGVGKREAAPAAPSVPPTPSGALRFAVAETGTATFLIDAPLEKIKGRSTQLRGSLSVDPSDLAKTTGQIDVDLDALKTETFDDVEKNAKQTEHSHNWLEIGGDVAATTRESNRWARLTVRSLDVQGPSALTSVPESNGTRVVRATVQGDLWIHGVTSPKSVPVTATFTGFPAGPVTVHVASEQPLLISLREHDIKPRDVAGKFLNGALERVGQKIDDKVQVSVDFSASAPKSELAASGQDVR